MRCPVSISAGFTFSGSDTPDWRGLAIHQIVAGVPVGICCGFGRGRALGSEPAVVGSGSGPGWVAIGAGGGGVGRGKALSPERVAVGTGVKPARRVTEETGWPSTPGVLGCGSCSRDFNWVWTVRETPPGMAIGRGGGRSLLARCPKYTKHPAASGTADSIVERSGAAGRATREDVRLERQTRRAGSGAACGTAAEGPGSEQAVSDGVHQYVWGYGTRHAGTHRHAGRHRHAQHAVGICPAAPRTHVVPGPVRAMLDRRMAPCDNSPMAEGRKTAQGPEDSNAKLALVALSPCFRDERRSNELMNLRAASAVAVACTADNAASTRRRPGPQLINRSLGRPPASLL